MTVSSSVESFVERRRRLAERLSGPAVLCSGLPRIRNFEANTFPFRSESHFLYLVGRHLEGALLLFDKGQATLFAQPPSAASALWHGPTPSLGQLGRELGMPVEPVADFVAPPECATIPPDDAESALWLEECIARALPSSAAELDGRDAVLADAVISLRLQADSAALAQLRSAANTTVEAHLAGMRSVVAARHEAHVRAAIETVFTAAGMGPAYQSIVTTRGNVLHNHSSDKRLEAGDILLADAGAETREGWAADVTRSYPVSGSFTRIQAAVYEAVLAAEERAIGMLAPGVRYRDVHIEAGRRLVEALVDFGLFDSGFSSVDELIADGAATAFFPHGLGHLLGLDVHDMEDLGDRAGYAPGWARSTDPSARFLRLDRPLTSGMVVTIEPGFYCIPAALEDERVMGPLRAALAPTVLEEVRSQVRGIRIEDDVLITETGAESLTASCPRTVREVEKELRPA